MRLYLRSIGQALLWKPCAWIDAGHRWLGWGAFPDSPIAEYLARSVSAPSGFYGGLLVILSTDIRRFASWSSHELAAAHGRSLRLCFVTETPLGKAVATVKLGAGEPIA